LLLSVVVDGSARLSHPSAGAGHRLGLVARMVEPIAPYLRALRRFSSKLERA
jgi:hypothetical protein